MIHNEEPLYSLWEQQAHPGARFVASGGERIVVISSGARNGGAGPDYREAVLLIDGLLRVGAVEMHREERDWFAHGHQHDRAYDEVILHVVGSRDPASGLTLPTIEADLLAASVSDNDLWETPPERIDGTFLAELAWGRLLRRVTAIIRAEPELPAAERMRRAFLRRLFDALGYSANRAPMEGLAALVLAREEELRGATFDACAAIILGASGLDRDRIAGVGRAFMSESRLHHILKNCDLPPTLAEWRYNTRPANAPERRLWGAAKLTVDLYRHDLLGRLYGAVAAGSFGGARKELVVRLGGTSMIGEGRAGEILLNALLPVALASGILACEGVRSESPRTGETEERIDRSRASRLLAAGACALYREAPASSANRLVRHVEERFLGGERLEGAFWQQGAIEFHQRYLSPDRSGLSFIAEPRHPTFF